MTLIARTELRKAWTQWEADLCVLVLRPASLINDAESTEFAVRSLSGMDRSDGRSTSLTDSDGRERGKVHLLLRRLIYRCRDLEQSRTQHHMTSV